MWIFVLLLFTLSHGLQGEEDFEKCLNEYRECSSKSEKIGKVPENELELNQACTILLEKFLCNQDLITRCEDVFGHQSERIKNILAGLDTICDQESRLHAALVENLSCYKTVLRFNRTCIDMERKFFASADFNEETPTIEYQKYSCVGNSIAVTCLVNLVEDLCDESAAITSLELLKEIKHVNDLCEEEFLPEYLEFLEKTDLDERMKNIAKIYLEFLRS